MKFSPLSSAVKVVSCTTDAYTSHLRPSGELEIEIVSHPISLPIRFLDSRSPLNLDRIRRLQLLQQLIAPIVIPTRQMPICE